ncbi:pyridoxal phosphate-dependent aminotransferase [Nitratireductor indicus]|uniref:pyridoxal phosphate-dependent aminotransferase n=1 Tax=Nitratireductor indicus TaxID=721133 RepID=UPI002874E97D|nr:pyridoxal phosphate-dependent aminotransferase [Nitratireductor indicus]MDS1137453.1 pyridoxal phosphate-dependent aminotransferase [Nitratireductor indicus]
MTLVASRMARVQPSASGMAAMRARQLIAAGHDIISLTVGEPDFDTPDHIRAAGEAAIRNGQTRYTNVDGIPALKQAVARKFLRENGLSYENNQIVVASGAKQVIFNAFLASVDPGDEVIIPAPYWVSYPDMVRLAGGEPVEVKCPAADGFKLTPERLEAAITPRTKLLVLNSPGNPSGAVYTRDELKALGEVLLQHERVGIVSDEIYEHITFGNVRFESIAAAEPRLANRTLVVNGVSKAYAMTGWRIGYGAGPADLIKEIVKLQSQSTSSASSISQAAALAALEGPQDEVHRNCSVFERRMKIIRAALNEAGLFCEEPGGAFYVYADCSAYIGKKRPDGRVIETDTDFAEYLLDEAKVAVIAGTAYGLSPFVRLSFAVADDRLAEAGSRILSACRKLA